MTTMIDFAAHGMRVHGARPAQRFLRDGEWAQRTYADVAQAAEEIALGLIDLGIRPGDRVGVFAPTSPEWTLCNLGIWAAGAVLVSIYPTNSAEEVEWVLSDSGSMAVVCGNPEQVAKVEQIRGSLPDLRHLVVIDGSRPLTLDDLRARGRSTNSGPLEAIGTEVHAQDPATFIYTSGTTGKPKGCVLTHVNNASVAHAVDGTGLVTADDTVYLFLPLAHVFAQLIQNSALHVGAEIIYCAGGPDQLVPELIETKPTVLPSVPRIFEKLYTRATAHLTDASVEARDLFELAVQAGVTVRLMRQRGDQVPESLQQSFNGAEHALFKGVRELFGGRLRLAISGAAPISAEVLRFFYACGVPVLEGFGMTETAGILSVNLLDALEIGTVGRPVAPAQARIAADGELEVSGPMTFREYWQDPEATKDAFTPDGWMRTGDLASIDEDGFITIIGRKKDIIITAGGKNLTPANLESDLKQSRWISQALMYGDRRPYPVALITLDEEEVASWAEAQGFGVGTTALASDPRVRALIQGVLDEANSRYARPEQIKRFAILDRDFSHESGELTPTLKIKRNVVYANHADTLADLYD